MKRKTKQLLLGIIIILVSIVVIYFNVKVREANFKTLWPAIILIIGMILYILYFTLKRKKNRLILLFLATFLAISTVPLFVLLLTGFDNIKYLWPGFGFALGMSILSIYFYGKKKKYVLTISVLIISLSLLVWILFALKSEYGLIIGVSLLIIGAAFFTRGLIKEPEEVAVQISGTSGENSGENQPDADQ